MDWNPHLKQPTPRGLEPAETKGGMRKKLLERRALEPLTSINSSTTPTWSVVWPLIPGYCCLPIQHALDNIHYLFLLFNLIPVILILFLYFLPFSDSIWHNITSLDEISASSKRVWDLHQLSYTYINHRHFNRGDNCHCTYVCRYLSN